MGDGTHDETPLLRVVRGSPTAEELAALVVALAPPYPSGSRVSGPSAWVRSTRPGAVAAGLPADRGPHAWRASTLPS